MNECASSSLIDVFDQCKVIVRSFVCILQAQRHLTLARVVGWL